MTSQIPNKAIPLPPGVYCPVLSIYKSTARQEVDLESSYKYFKFLVLGGVTGLVLAGTTAEAVLLTADERVELTKVAKKVVTDLGLPDYPLVAGISGQSTNESIRFAEAAAAAGANFGLLLPPSYWSKVVTKDVILGFYRDVADASPIPVVIYNVRLCSTELLYLHSKADSIIVVPSCHSRYRPRFRPYYRACTTSQYRGGEVDLRKRGKGHASGSRLQPKAIRSFWRIFRLPHPNSHRRG